MKNQKSLRRFFSKLLKERIAQMGPGQPSLIRSVAAHTGDLPSPGSQL